MKLMMICAVLSLVFASCAKVSVEDATHSYQKSTVQYKELSGVDANLLSLDIYHFGNSSIPRPVIFYVHGGGWAIGDKANKLNNKLNLFYSLNYIFVSINYRLSPDPAQLDNDGRVKFPDHNLDVADALGWVYNNISDYGGDSLKIAIMGHSAGAHLVALTGTSQAFLPAIGVPLDAIKGVVCLDTEGYEIELSDVEENEIYENAFGKDAQTLSDASPINQIETGINYPRFFIAKRGSNKRIELADKFIEKLESMGVLVSQTTCSKYSHEEINDAVGASDEEYITPALVDFLATCFM